MKLWQASLCISTPGTSVTDDELTVDTIARHNMNAASGKFVKSLYGHHLNPYNQRARIARRDYHQLTFEGIGAIRLVVLDERQKFLDRMAAHESVLRELAEDFVNRYPQILNDERKGKGNAFRDEDYPSPGQLAERFSVRYTVLPMPEPSAFLKDALADGVSEALAAEYKKKLENTTKQISNSVLNTLLALIADTAESLAGEGNIVDSENRKGPFAKLHEYLERIPALNITNDPRISAIAADCKDKLNYSAERIRASGTTRTLVALRAANIAQTHGGFTGRKIFKQAA